MNTLDIILQSRIEAALIRDLEIKREQFQKLKYEFSIAYEKILEEEFYKKERKRKYGGGRKRKLSSTEVLLLFIFKIKYNVTFVVLGWFFRISEASAYRYFILAKKVLKRILPLPLDGFEESLIKIIEEDIKEVKVNSLEDFLKIIGVKEEAILLADVTEQPIGTPKDKEDRTKYYSGKEKEHTVKLEMLMCEDKITWINGLYEGSKHDKKIFEESLLKEINKLKQIKINLFLDKGYEGIEKLILSKTVKVYIPKKERKELSEIEKEKNKYINQERVKIEHMFGKMELPRKIV